MPHPDLFHNTRVWRAALDEQGRLLAPEGRPCSGVLTLLRCSSPRPAQVLALACRFERRDGMSSTDWMRGVYLGIRAHPAAAGAGLTAFLLCELGFLDRWSLQAGKRQVLLAPDWPARTIDVLLRESPQGLALWLQHVATLEELHALLPGDRQGHTVGYPSMGRPLQPQVGLGCTVVQGRALYAATIHRVSACGTELGVRRDLIEPLGKVGTLSVWSMQAHPGAPLEWFARDQGGWTCGAGAGQSLHVGARHVLDSHPSIRRGWDWPGR